MASSTDSGWTRIARNMSDSNQSLSDLPTDCIILGFNETIPWDNPHNLVSYETEGLIDRLKNAVFTPILFLVGFPSNVVNMAVFYKQGLKDRINMCLFALAVADILNITFWFIFYAERMYNQFTDNEKFPPSFRFIMNSNIVGLVGLMYVPPLLSAVIATERCVCVLFPLRAQRCVPTKAMALVIFIVAIPVVFLQFLATVRFQVACFHEIRAGRTSWMVDETLNRDKVNPYVLQALNVAFYGFSLSLGCPLIVLFTTTITAVRLSQVVKWRKQASSSVSSTAMSSKEVGLTKMLICLSVEFFVLSIPIVVLRVWYLFEKELIVGGLYHNTTHTLILMYQLCFYASSSVNFFVYYCAGTKFRQTLRAMMTRQEPVSRKTMASTASSTTA